MLSSLGHLPHRGHAKHLYFISTSLPSSLFPAGKLKPLGDSGPESQPIKPIAMSTMIDNIRYFIFAPKWRFEENIISLVYSSLNRDVIVVDYDLAQVLRLIYRH